MSLRLRLLLLVVLAVIPAIAIEIYGEIELRATRQGEIRQEAFRILRLVAAEQQRIDEGVRQLLVAFSEAPVVRAGNWTACNEMASQVRARVEGYVDIGVASPDGSVLCSTSPRDTLPRLFVEDMAPTGDLLIGTYRADLATGQRRMAYAIALPRGSAGAPGIAFADLDLDWLARHFADRFSSPNMTLLLADRMGTILVRLPNNDAWAGKPMGNPYMPMLMAAQEGVEEAVGIDGRARIIAYSPLSRAPKQIYVGIGLSKAPYFAPIDAASRQKAILISLSFALALAAAWFGGSAFITRPIDRLLIAARLWKAGNYAARAGLSGRRSEIGRLGQAFDEMAAAVESREKMRRDAEEALAQLNRELEQRVKAEVAERESAQAALVQAQKIDAVGKLTSGVAHDFNNLLAAVMGNLELMRRRVNEPRSQKLLDNALRAATRGAKLTEQLLAFSRGHHLEPKPFDVNELIAGMSDLLARTLGPQIGISRALAPEVWPVLGDANQIEVALLNLAINARDAMPLGGTLLIETANLTAGNKRLPAALAGDFVVVSVSDTGAGMDETVKARAFEPFFTTKDVGKGTGLGLSMVYGVAKQCGGTATIESEPGKGTTVALFLPRASATPTRLVEGPVEPVEEVMTPLPASASVLVVDDDRDVRETTAAVLTDHGLDVTAVESGQAALSLIEQGTPFDLIIVDYAMPGINGLDVIAGARVHRPQIAAILVTGYAERGLVDDLPADVPVLRKPVRSAELTTQVGKALTAAATAPASNVVALKRQ